jgi:GNAT superfamily N-acetyltransferase
MIAAGVELRARRDDDLDECERLARAVLEADGYPPRCADDLRGFISTPDALGAWVAECDGGIVGHVALHPRGSPEVMARAADATGRSPEQLCVVARLFVSPSHRGKGLGRSLLAGAAEAGRTRGLWPILDVAAHFATAIRLYEGAGWTCAGRVSAAFPGEEPLDELVYVAPGPDGAGRPMARKS